MREVVIPPQERRRMSPNDGRKVPVSVNGATYGVPVGKPVQLRERVIGALEDAGYAVLTPEEYQARLEAQEAKLAAIEASQNDY